MANYGDLKTRIRAEMIRDDLNDGEALETQLTLHIGRAIEFYATWKFWFNSIVTTGTTTANTACMTIPTTVRVIERITIPAYDTELREVQLGQIDDYPSYSLPSEYAYYNSSIKFYPIPDQAYTLNFYGIAQVAAPTSNSSSSIWTNEAQDLICARVKKNLCRAQFRDPTGAALAETEEQEELSRLLRETARKLETPLRSRATGGGYDINTDR